MAEKSKGHWLAEWFRDKIAEHIIGIVLGIVYTTILGWSAWMEQNVIPVLYIVVLITAGLCFFVAGIAYFGGILYRSTAKDKLRFATLTCAIKTEVVPRARGRELGKPYIAGVKIGFTLNNMAHFPIKVLVENVATRLDGKCPIDEDGKPIQHKSLEVVVPPGANGFVNDWLVPIDTAKAKKAASYLRAILHFPSNTEERAAIAVSP